MCVCVCVCVCVHYIYVCACFLTLFFLYFQLWIINPTLAPSGTGLVTRWSTVNSTTLWLMVFSVPNANWWKLRGSCSFSTIVARLASMRSQSACCSIKVSIYSNSTINNPNVSFCIYLSVKEVMREPTATAPPTDVYQLIPPSPPPPCKPGEFHHTGDRASRQMWQRGAKEELQRYYGKAGGYICPKCEVWVWTWEDFCAAHSGAPSFAIKSKSELYNYGKF